MEDLVEKLLSSGNKILEAAGKDIGRWASLKHTKADLELFLQFNLVHLKFRPFGGAVYKEIVCTSCTPFIKAYAAVKWS